MINTRIELPLGCLSIEISDSTEETNAAGLHQLLDKNVLESVLPLE